MLMFERDASPNRSSMRSFSSPGHPLRAMKLIAGPGLTYTIVFLRLGTVARRATTVSNAGTARSVLSHCECDRSLLDRCVSPPNAGAGSNDEYGSGSRGLK